MTRISFSYRAFSPCGTKRLDKIKSTMLPQAKEGATMKITDIRAMRLTMPPRPPVPPGTRPSWWQTAEVANPMSRYPKVKAHRSLWRPNWEDVWCKVTLEDGSWGLGHTGYGRPVA